MFHRGRGLTLLALITNSLGIERQANVLMDSVFLCFYLNQTREYLVKTDCRRCFDPHFSLWSLLEVISCCPCAFYVEWALCRTSNATFIISNQSCGGLVCSDRSVLQLNTSHNSVFMKTHEKSWHSLQVFFTTVLEQPGSTRSSCRCEEPLT